MKTGLELITELEAKILRLREIQEDRRQRMANNEMDLDDCFRSVNANAQAVKELKAKIEILKRGGVATFKRLATLDGHIIENSRLIDGEYGECWLVDDTFVNIPSAGCKAGKKVWVVAGFKNQKEAHNNLCAEWNTDEYRDRNDLYYTLVCKAKAMGMAEKGYRVVEVERPAWIRMKSGNSILHSYPCIFESDTNYFTGE